MIQTASAAYQGGDLRAAEAASRRALDLDPRCFEALLILGAVQVAGDRRQDAIVTLTRAREQRPDNFDVLTLLGRARLGLGEFEPALRDYEAALRVAPDHPTALAGRGNALGELLRFSEAEASFRSALKRDPNSEDALGGLGYVLNREGRFAEAVPALRRAVANGSQRAAIHKDLAWALHKQGDLTSALTAAQRANELMVDFADALQIQGLCLLDLERREEAVVALSRLLELDPDRPDGLFWRAEALYRLQKFGEAGKDLRRLVDLGGDYPGAVEECLLLLRTCCDWGSDEMLMSQLMRSAESGTLAGSPFAHLSLLESPAWLKDAAKRHADRNGLNAVEPLPPQRKRAEPGRLRIGYVAGAFRQHPVAFLILNLLEAHDRNRFEILGVSMGHRDGSEIGERCLAAFDSWIDVRGTSDEDAAKSIRALNCDILVDLAGFADDGRPGIFARRPCAIQVNYLGYPGTMGAAFMDYIVADPVLIRPGEEPHYAEAVCRLPHCYQSPSPHRNIPQAPTRASQGLPDTGFVFCSFNNMFKISPRMFDVWMSLLQARPGSVLWMLADAHARDNLKAEVERRGVDPGRLIFASRASHPEHMARQQCADLFLDSFPYNAHTTASEALFVGLPLVTLRGETFASRVAASILETLGVPELVTTSLADYERLVLELSDSPDRLAAIRERVRAGVRDSPMFDVPRFARNIEAAYSEMATRAEAGQAPSGFDVSDQSA